MQAKSQLRVFNEPTPRSKCPKSQVNSHFILDMMRQNDTLVVKRGVEPLEYFQILIEH
jgi:hypothetical protein